MKFIQSVAQHIPGLRKLSPSSMVIAVTYYGVAGVTAFRYWYWGLALLALPFFVFCLVGIDRQKHRKRAIAVAAVLAAAILGCTAIGLSSGGFSAKMPESSHPLASLLSADSTYKATLGLITASTIPTNDDAPTGAPSVAQIAAVQASSAGQTASLFFTSTKTPLAADTKTTETPSADPVKSELAYVATKSGKVFHLSTCSSAKRIKKENLVTFKTREEAVKKGLVPCKLCKP